MNKPFLGLFNRKNEINKSAIQNKPDENPKEKSKVLIIFGFIISIASIFLLLYTINNKFGWFN